MSQFNFNSPNLPTETMFSRQVASSVDASSRHNKKTIMGLVGLAIGIAMLVLLSDSPPEENDRADRKPGQTSATMFNQMLEN